MDFRANNPGAVQFGNFINYYKFHSANDRLSLFPDDDRIWKTTGSTSEKFFVLDIGCNSGDVSQELFQYLTKRTGGQDIQILGIDIDPMLIQRANENNKFPDNIRFECVDIMSSKLEHFTIKFDAVFCLSITMWIHLNHGDQGLLDFLEKARSLSKSILVVEPQPWKCYLNAVSRMKKAKESFEQFPKLKIRNNVEQVIETTLKDWELEKLYETVPTKWNRKICFYKLK